MARYVKNTHRLKLKSAIKNVWHTCLNHKLLKLILVQLHNYSPFIFLVFSLPLQH